MLRELAKLQPDQAHDWLVARRNEAITALERGTISQEVAESVLNWAIDNYCSYLTALDRGYIRLED